MDAKRRTVKLNGEEKVIDHVSTITDWVTSLSKLPDIDFCDIFLYLMNSCNWDNERLKNYKNDNGHRLFLGSHIDNVQLSGTLHQHYSYVCATCVPETRQSAAPYNVLVLIKDSGEISSGGCSCVVDNGTCKHCVALLFGLQSFCVRHKDRSTEVGTDVQCTWDKPRRESQPMEIDNIDTRKDPTLVAVVTPSTNYCKPSVTNIKEDETARKLKNICKGTNALLLQTLHTESDESDGETELPTLADAVKNSNKFPIDAIKSVFNQDTIKQIEEETRGQSDNPAWFSHRQGRITASLISSVISFRYTDNDENYLSKQILGTSARLSSAALNFGKTYEPIARQLYVNDYVKSHKSVSIRQAGLFIDHENPFLGASPDGLVSCKCCGKGLLEIKCSFSHQNKTPIEVCEDNHYHVYADENNEMRLKTSSSWYIQIQAQLGVCKRNWCDFVLFTKKGHAVDRILFDNELFNEITQKSRKFFERYIMNSL